MHMNFWQSALVATAMMLFPRVGNGGSGGGLEPLGPDFTFGLLLVGPHDDHGWSEAHYVAGLYLEQKIAGARMTWLENVYPGSPLHAGATAAQLAERLVGQGARLIIFNSDDMKDEATRFAQDHPDIYVIMASGDQVWPEGRAYLDLPNLVNVMGRMEYGKMIAGCTAALTSQTGKIGYLGPLINDETRRLAASAYLGAKYAWTHYRGRDLAELRFKVRWIGFWFHIPGVTVNPSEVARDFFQSGHDVVVSGIDSIEALAEANARHSAGQQAWAIPYDYRGACEGGNLVCLGVPFFNWGPAYLATVRTAMNGTWTSRFLWNAPDWSNINDPDTSAVGFVQGQALSPENAAGVDRFVAELAGGLNLWTGPLALQDGTAYLAAGVAATDQQIWYLPRLLEGMEGQSVPVTPPRLGLASAQPLTAAGLELTLAAQSGTNCRIEASSDLRDWTEIMNLVSTNEVTFFRDAGATNYARRYYRAVTQ
jgi:simple sugar transport system substrate-binding protein